MIRFFLAGIIFLLCACSGDDKSESLPYRSDCIVRVIILNDEIEKEQLESMINEIARAIAGARRKGFSGDRPDLAITRDDRKSIYLQYDNNCSDKKNITSKLFDQYVIPYISGSLNYEISDEVVYPSPETIDVQGEFWRD